MSAPWIIRCTQTAEEEMRKFCTLHSEDDGESFEAREQELYDWCQELAENARTGHPALQRFPDLLRFELQRAVRLLLTALHLQDTKLGRFLVHGLNRLLRDYSERGASHIFYQYREQVLSDGLAEIVIAFELRPNEIHIRSFDVQYSMRRNS